MELLGRHRSITLKKLPSGAHLGFPVDAFEHQLEELWERLQYATPTRARTAYR